MLINSTLHGQHIVGNSLCRYISVPHPSTLSKIAAVGLAVFLGIAYYNLSEQLGYAKAHPEAERSFFGFGSLKKAPFNGPFYHAT